MQLNLVAKINRLLQNMLMKNMMEYKGYFGSVNYDDDDRIFYGKVEYIRSLISYEGVQ